MPSGVWRARQSAADAVILDLEDGLAPAQRPLARQALPAQVRALQQAGKPVLVRVNHALLHLAEDLRAVLASGADGLMLPKAEQAQTLCLLNEALITLGAPPALGVVALVETPAALADAAGLRALAAAPRVRALALGPEDYAAAMQAEPTAALLAPAVLALVQAARCVPGCRVFAMPLSITVSDGGASWAEAARQARGLGANGALCIHPRQLAAVQAAFSPDAAQLRWATELLQAAAERPGEAVFLHQGRMVDAPVLARARSLLALAGAQP